MPKKFKIYRNTVVITPVIWRGETTYMSPPVQNGHIHVLPCTFWPHLACESDWSSGFRVDKLRKLWYSWCLQYGLCCESDLSWQTVHIWEEGNRKPYTQRLQCCPVWVSILWSGIVGGRKVSGSRSVWWQEWSFVFVWVVYIVNWSNGWSRCDGRTLRLYRMESALWHYMCCVAKNTAGYRSLHLSSNMLTGWPHFWKHVHLYHNLWSAWERRSCEHFGPYLHLWDWKWRTPKLITLQFP